jgi:nucleoside-diphosphate-sugar epimerase
MAVVALVRPGSGAQLPEGVERLEHDLAASPLPSAAFEGVDYAIHLAGLVGEKPYSELFASNANATKNLLYFCPTSIRKIVLASSISVYGLHPGKEVDEGERLEPQGDYGRSKLAAEEFAHDYCDSLPIVFLRIAMVYGPGFEEGYSQVLSLLERGKMKIIGDGKNRLPLVHIDDVISAIFLAMEKETSRGAIYNVCGQERSSQQELLELAAKKLGAPPPVGHVSPAIAGLAAQAMPFLGKKGIAPHAIWQLASDRAYSIRKATQELGWAPKVRLEEGVAQMVKLYKENKTAE